MTTGYIQIYILLFKRAGYIVNSATNLFVKNFYKVKIKKTFIAVSNGTQLKNWCSSWLLVIGTLTAFLPESESGTWNLMMSNWYLHPKFICSRTSHCFHNLLIAFSRTGAYWDNCYWAQQEIGSVCFFLWVLVSLFLWGLWVTICRK